MSCLLIPLFSYVELLSKLSNNISIFINIHILRSSKASTLNNRINFTNTSHNDLGSTSMKISEFVLLFPGARITSNAVLVYFVIFIC